MKFFKKQEEEQQSLLAEELGRKIAASGMPDHVRKVALEELEAIARISPSSAEYTIGITYVDYLITLPWDKKTEDNLDLCRAERILNEDHFGLMRTKERILEHLAVRVLRSKARPRVLIVDDEEIARKNLSHILEKDDYEVVSAEEGGEALTVMEKGEFDVVLTDLKMAGIDGMEVLEKTRMRWPDTKVIMMTGFATVQSAIEAMKRGAFNYIAKPFKLDEVRSTVRTALEKRARIKGGSGSVLCFAGPPGTGKTSVGRSVARALGRAFVRISLAGMKDEAEIRGHRRTYVGAMPGRIIEEIHRAESANPVMMLDELDKIGHDFKGDPSSALLEVLDTEQNAGFVDHYLGVPFDLSQVIFILTANVIDNIPGPLRDRMEVIEFPGYSLEEKAHIAAHFLIPRQIREKGISARTPVFSPEAIEKIIQEYTREAGIRNLERKIASICRKIAKETVGDAGGLSMVTITPAVVGQYLGRRNYEFEVVEEKDRVGVATGLVRTAEGGEIIFVEAAKMKGKKEMILTGSLGDMMRESAQAALSYIRSNAAALGIQDDFFEIHDIHVHVPSGAIQKDGPSAGITMAMALISLLTNRPARRDVAMTGEITLTGRVLPVSGIREKILAARRAGVRTVLLPAKNRAEADELPVTVTRDVAVKFIESIGDAIELVLAKTS